MEDERYSTYEARARFSELLKKVREGRTLTITHHGEPVAELRPIRKKQGLAERIEWLESQGVIVRGRKPRGKLEPIAHRPGALKRFLEERD